MNIFVTSPDPAQCASDLPDILLRKMIVETAQILCTAHRVLDGNEWADYHSLYKETHKNHPCSLWARESNNNYNWLYFLFSFYLDEYWFRFQKQHKCFKLLELYIPPTNAPVRYFTSHPLCMPDEYKLDNVYESYQNYLLHKRLNWATRTDKRQIQMTWTNRDEPKWMEGWNE